MFVRTKTFKNKDGSTREYLFICETRREGNKVRQITLANLGRLDSIDTQRTIDNLIDSLAKFSKKRAILNLSKGLFADWAKLYGPVLVFKALWQKTGLKGKAYCLKTMPTTTWFRSALLSFEIIKKEIFSRPPPKNQKNLDIHCFILYYFIKFYGLIKYKRKKVRFYEGERKRNNDSQTSC